MIDASHVAENTPTPQAPNVKPVITVRLPPDLKKRVDDSAHRDKLSINQFCIAAIECYVEASEAEAKEAIKVNEAVSP